MRILLCCEFYPPSVGGVQEVMRQLAERLVAHGHEVTIATTKLAARPGDELNGVKIKGFDISGNLVRGIAGDVNGYRHFVTTGDFDIVMIKAAQQWAFDALWPVLPAIKIPKVFIPCGFSSFYEPAYSDYFRQLPTVLQQFDQLIFYASDYRDITFAREHGITNFCIIPNGACEIEFSVGPDPDFRKRLGIGANDFLYLTVGSFTGLKGHLEVVKAFSEIDIGDQRATLILNGNQPANLDNGVIGLLRKAVGIARVHGFKLAVKHGLKVALRRLGISVGKNSASISDVADAINKQQRNKRVLVSNFSRPELVQAFMAADLFVFASNVEYSPLVLYESAAAGTPFLSVPVGNAEEIARWTGAGEICPAERDERGYTRVDPKVLAQHMARLARDPVKLNRLGAAGRENWKQKFTWDKITAQYENVFNRLVRKEAIVE